MFQRLRISRCSKAIRTIYTAKIIPNSEMKLKFQKINEKINKNYSEGIHTGRCIFAEFKTTLLQYAVLLLI